MEEPEVIVPEEELEDDVLPEDDEDMEVEAEEVEAPKKGKKGKKVAVESAPVVVSGSIGTLGDARVDDSIPLAPKGRAYLSKLLESPLVTSIVPPDYLNEDTEHTFCINSLRVIVPKGKMIQVPFILSQEIAQSFKNRF